MTYEAIIETVVAEPMAAVAARATQQMLPKVIPTALDKVWEVLRSDDYGPLGCNTVYYAPMMRGAEFDLLCGVRLAAPFAPKGEVRPAETPAGEVSHVVYFGEYSRMHPAHQAAQEGASAHGRKLTGASWEVYGDWFDDWAKVRTDIFYLLEPRS
jgi:effector-binding domain-containing protein